MRFTSAHYSLTPRDPWQGFGKLHGRSGGVVLLCLPFSYPFRQGAPAFDRLAAGQSIRCLSFFRFSRGTGKKVVRSGDVGLCWITRVQLLVSLQSIFKALHISSVHLLALIPAVAEPTRITPVQVCESTSAGSNVLQTV
jgi:hypothetical protein